MNGRRKIARHGRLAAALLAVAVTATSARAHDVGITGSKLVLLDRELQGLYEKKEKVVIAARLDAGIHAGSGSGDPADLSGEVRICPVDDPSEVSVFALPAPWAANTPALAKYVNPAAAALGPGVKRVLVKPGNLLKVTGVDLGDGDGFGSDPGPNELDFYNAGDCQIGVGDEVAVEIAITDAATAETHRMCTRFTIDTAKGLGMGEQPGCKLISRNAVPAACGLCTPSTTTTSSSSTTTTAP
jgi:hypothetical protein